MGHGRRTVTVHHVRAALRGAQRLGLDTVPLLQRARIPPLLLADDRARVSPEQFARLVRALHRATADEFLGLGTIRSRPGTFAMMCYASLGCPDLGTAVDRGARFYRLFPGGPDLALERGAGRGREAVFALRGGLGPHEDALTAAESHIVAEWLMLIWHRVAGWLIGRRIPLLWAQFAYPPPPYAEDYEPLFGCPPRFGAPRTAAGFDRRWLTAPIVQDESTLQTLLRHAPAGLLSRRDYRTTVAEQVRHALTGALRTRGGPADGPRARHSARHPARLPELPEVAARLAVSPATLRRRLREEGTSFQELKDTVRRDEAVSSLAEGVEPIADLALRLGFSEDTAFHRAFRRWTGTTPGAYRHETRSQHI